MMFDWNKFGELAEELRQRDDEASLRTAISRIITQYIGEREICWKAKVMFSVKTTHRTAKFGASF